MSGIVVICEALEGGVSPGSLEALSAGAACSEASGEGLVAAILAPEPEVHVGEVSIPGVDEVLLVRAPSAIPDAQELEAAFECLLDAEAASLVLASQSTVTTGFVPAVAARGGHGFASDVTSIAWEDGWTATRPAYSGKLEASTIFPGKSAVLLLLRGGAFEASGADARGTEPPVREIPTPEGAARTQHLGRREPAADGVDITTAPFLISVGRGIEDREDLERFETLADRAGAVLSASRPMVDAGWVEPSRQVGQSGKSVAPRVYLAFGISGAVQHLAGISGAETVIAINTDPDAPIFGVADFGAVADMFDVADELERVL